MHPASPSTTARLAARSQPRHPNRPAPPPAARPLPAAAAPSYNATLFAYGQTGSGKTFTITGGAERYADRGVVPRALAALFSEIKRRADAHYQVENALGCLCAGAGGVRPFLREGAGRHAPTRARRRHRGRPPLLGERLRVGWRFCPRLLRRGPGGKSPRAPRAASAPQTPQRSGWNRPSCSAPLAPKHPCHFPRPPLPPKNNPKVWVSYLEVYNEAGYDLLDPAREVAALEDMPQARGRRYGEGAGSVGRGCVGGCAAQGRPGPGVGAHGAEGRAKLSREACGAEPTGSLALPVPPPPPPQVIIQEDEEGRVHLRNLSCHPAASEEEALNLVRAVYV
jgi:hypothetical protein